jgi:hypothetical protein
MFYADTSESDEAHVSSNWLQVTDCGPRPNTYISVQNIELKAIVPSGFGWTTQLVQYFHLFFDMDMLKHPTGNDTEWEQNGECKVCHLQRELRITDWAPPTLADIRTLFGVVINMGLQSHV